MADLLADQLVLMKAFLSAVRKVGQWASQMADLLVVPKAVLKAVYLVLRWVAYWAQQWVKERLNASTRRTAKEEHSTFSYFP